MRLNNLFDNLYNADNEEQVEKIIQEVEEKFSSEVEWKKLGNQESNYGVVENQQSHPVGALIEKLTNSIDAILMKKCREAEIDPESKESPQSMREAVEKKKSSNSFGIIYPPHGRISFWLAGQPKSCVPG